MNALLTELLNRKVRLWIYLLAIVVALIVAAWQASEGNWLVFAASLAGALQSSMAAGNLTPEPAAVVAKVSDQALADAAFNRGKTLVDLERYIWMKNQTGDGVEPLTAEEQARLQNPPVR
jgi:hypothetical protein